ncbi:MAG: DUF4340 domain-containing protein [Bdellovibrionaceae bacterium]|nr:DUF4340 domain-containing protein [Pseudobdellovibrionaceae bacterium]
MKSFKSTFVFAVLVLLLGIATFLEFNRSEKEEKSKDEQTKALPYWDQSQISELRIVSEDRDLHLIKKDSQWQILSPIKDKADISTVESMLSSMITDKLSKLELEGSAFNLSQYGFDEAKRFMEFINNSNTKKKLMLSSKKTYDGKYYLKYSDSPDVYLASSTWDQWIRRSVNEIRNKKLFSDQDKIKKLTIIDGKKKISFENIDSQWIIDGDKNFPVNETKLKTLISSLQNFRAADVSAEEQSTETLKKYKLVKPGLKLILELDGSESPIELNVSDLTKDSGDIFLYSNHLPFIYKTFKTVVEKWVVSKSDFKKESDKKESEKDINKNKEPMESVH